eukprot:1161442-Pelagomonas_calceolata.AAC.9
MSSFIKRQGIVYLTCRTYSKLRYKTCLQPEHATPTLPSIPLHSWEFRNELGLIAPASLTVKRVKAHVISAIHERLSLSALMQDKNIGVCGCMRPNPISRNQGTTSHSCPWGTLACSISFSISVPPYGVHFPLLPQIPTQDLVSFL